RHEVIIPPHRKLALPQNLSAIYVFSLSSKPKIVLKVGKAGPNSVARFVSQHYLPSSCKSNLAKSICANQSTWEILGISSVDHARAGQWLRAYTNRDHFFMENGAAALSLLECFLQCRLKPLFEG